VITWKILIEETISLSSSLCSFLYSPATPSLLGQIFSSVSYSQAPSAYVPPSVWMARFHNCRVLNFFGVPNRRSPAAKLCCIISSNFSLLLIFPPDDRPAGPEHLRQCNILFATSLWLIVNQLLL
jgi:hypothetical protein